MTTSDTTPTDELIVDSDGGVLRVTFNAPERLNSVDTPLVHALTDTFLAHRDARVAVIRGAGKAFCAGAKLSTGGPNPGILDAVTRLITAMTSTSYPIVAAVDGPAAGLGCSIALAADLVVASERSYFLQAFVHVGLMPDGGANELLAASIGRARTAWLAMSGEKLPATEAHVWGLIGSCVPDDKHEQAVESLVERLATGPTLALERTKKAINSAAIPTLARTLDYEAAAQTLLLGSDDYREGVAAFSAKRPARFTGR